MTDDPATLGARIDGLLEKPLCFVVGCQKSGTTWVQAILDGHPEVACHGETALAQVVLPVVSQLVSTFNQQQQYRHAQFNASDPLTEVDGHALFKIISAYLLSRHVDLNAVSCVGEKTPEHAMVMPQLYNEFPHSKFIHVIRDGRDAAVSGYFHNVRQNGQAFSEQFPDMATYITYFAQSHWKPYIMAARAFGHARPNAYHELRYETLLTDTPTCIRNMLEFLNVDASKAKVDACLHAGDFGTMTGGRSRGDENRESFFRKGVAGDWQQHFDAACHDAFNNQAGDLLNELGYNQ